jgi:hypothetical protein
MKFFLILLLIANILVFGLRWKYPDAFHEKKVTSGTFHMKFGGAVCGESYTTECGVHLKKCDNEVEYHCMHDVSMRLDY